MDNLFAIETSKRAISILEPRIPFNIPTKLNPKGVRQNIIKGAGVIAGGILSFIPPSRVAGIALTQMSLRFQTQDAIVDEKPFDTVFYQLKNEIMSIEYDKIHRMLR